MKQSEFEASLTIQRVERFSPKELQSDLGIEWRTAKCLSQELSRIVRAIRKGAKLFLIEGVVHLWKITGQHVSELAVIVLENIFGIEWRQSSLLNTN